MRKLIALFLLAALLLCGCTTGETVYVPTGNGLSDDTGDTPIIDSSTEPQSVTLTYYPDRSLNPYECTDLTNRVLFSLIYQGLFTVDESYNCSPMLCKSYNLSTDMKTYTFYIENALFSDGTALTAEDVVASLKAAQDSAWYGGRLQYVKSISNYGDAVVIELTTAMENLPVLLDIPIVKASEVAAAQPLGTGPYRMAEGQLRRQAAWWCSATLPVSGDTIDLVAAESASQIRDNFEFGDVSLVCTNPGDRSYVTFHSDYELWDCENGMFLYLVCNSESTLFANASIRSALTFAIDRDSLVENVYNGFAHSASLPASPQSPYYNSALASQFDYAPGVLAAALEEAAITEPSVTLLLNADDPVRLAAGQAIAAMLEAEGLTVTITKATTDTFVSLLKKGEYDLYLAQTRLSANMDLSAFFAPNGSLRYGGLTNASLEALSLEALANSGNYYTLHERIMGDGQLCPILFQSVAVYSTRGALSGLTPARDNVFYYDLGRSLKDAYMSQ